MGLNGNLGLKILLLNALTLQYKKHGLSSTMYKANATELIDRLSGVRNFDSSLTKEMKETLQ